MNLSGIANTLLRAYGLYTALDSAGDSLGLGSLRTALSGQGLSGNTATLRTPSAAVTLSESGRTRAALSELKVASTALNSRDKVAAARASSDNDAISASISDSSKLPVTAVVSVSQLAQSQSVQSASFADRDSSSLGTGTLTIELGSYSSSGNSFTATPGSSTRISISTGKSTLGGIANAINAADAGVKASVVADGSRYRLVLSGAETGSEQAFRIRVDDADGSDKDNTQGLSRLAYDPTEQPGSGRNLQATRSAQDAVLSVDGEAVLSASNTVDGAVQGASLTVSAVGEAEISFSRDADAALQSARSLASAVNRYSSQLPVPRSGTASRVDTEISNLFGRGSQRTDSDNAQRLADVGITRSSNGRVSVDEERFSTAFADDPEAVSELLASSASRLEKASTATLDTGQRSSMAGLRASDYLAQLRAVSPASSQASQQLTLLSYLPTTSSAYGVLQYEAVSGL